MGWAKDEVKFDQCVGGVSNMYLLADCCGMVLEWRSTPSLSSASFPGDEERGHLAPVDYPCGMDGGDVGPALPPVPAAELHPDGLESDGLTIHDNRPYKSILDSACLASGTVARRHCVYGEYGGTLAERYLPEYFVATFNEGAVVLPEREGSGAPYT